MTDLANVATYIVTIEDTGAEWRAVAYPVAHVQIDGNVIIEARAKVSEGVTTFDNEAWQAGADALAAIMPEPEEDR